ncbi:unnamed protein product [Trifolium pratense]|uniref:Uncharacterized protein n=1 Tax=Trifolium pratense TaxID=57577 RepID=A0ACB0LX54_TRIPR|nr:unnamed protein product [Trifolium pratense]
MAPTTYLSLMLILSLFTISHAISPTSSSNLYKDICKKSFELKDLEQRCLKLLEPYPQITSANDYLTFTKLFLKTVAIEKAIKAQQQMIEIMKKNPSSQGIKDCFLHYKDVLSELQIAYDEDPGTISLDVAYANDALVACKRSLSNEKIVNISSISVLNDEMHFVVDIAFTSSSNIPTI